MNTHLTAATTLAGLVASASSAFAIPATLSANFNGLTPDTLVNSGYSEGGLTFTSPTPFAVASRSWAGTLFGWGGYVYAGNALSVHNNGWVGITAGGELMAAASFSYGFDWSGYAIEYGLMDVAVEWRAMLDGVLIGSGGHYFDRDRRSHGGALETSSGGAFDELQVRSTAVLYQGIYTGGSGPGGWTYERGAVLGFGDLNHLAFDNVTVTTAGGGEPPQQFAHGFAQAPVTAPDLPWTLPLAAFSFLMLAYVARRFPVRT